jgi:hypothetical protein
MPRSHALLATPLAAVVSLSIACNPPTDVKRSNAKPSRPTITEADIPEETRKEIFFAVERAMLEAENDPEWQRLEKLIRSRSGKGDDRVADWLDQQNTIDDKYTDPVLNRFNVSESDWATIYVEGTKKRWAQQSTEKTRFSTPLP